MAISHIPRSVGHNFAPEYQISAAPFIVNLSTATSTYIIKKDDTNVIVGTAEAEDGFVTTNGEALDTDIFNDTNNPPAGIQDDEKLADNLKQGFSRVEVKKIELPKISQWIQFLPTPANAVGIIVGFSKTDIAKANTLQFLDTNTVKPPVPFRIRCTNLYFTDTGLNGKLLVGLTSIDRSEFANVIETFLGD